VQQFLHLVFREVVPAKRNALQGGRFTVGADLMWVAGSFHYFLLSNSTALITVLLQVGRLST
jgi:hypothetical protein